jgi:hypothetical protein
VKSLDDRHTLRLAPHYGAANNALHDFCGISDQDSIELAGIINLDEFSIGRHLPNDTVAYGKTNLTPQPVYLFRV